MPRKKAAAKKSSRKSPAKPKPSSERARRDPSVQGVDPIDQMENEGGNYRADDPWADAPPESDWFNLPDSDPPADNDRELVRGDLDEAIDELEEDLACEIEELESFITDRLERLKSLSGRI